jgi:membrane associated rhomboid family serine protease
VELAILWITSLLVVFGMQGEDAGFTERFCNSSLAVIRDGEWWRPFTSLFLHGDLNHMIGNIGFGVIFCVLVAHTVGPVLGWVLILASGAIGNLLTAGIRYPEEFQSVGASTATFGALGILVGVGAQVAWQARSYRKLGASLVPVGAGVIMLGWFGAGGENTDVAAHVAGFGVGAVLGLAASWRQMRRPPAQGEAA